MVRDTDVRVRQATLFFLPVKLRVPLRFGAETLTALTCARVRLAVEDRRGRRAEGWGETPLSVQWVWPGSLSYYARQSVLCDFCMGLAKAWSVYDRRGHPVEVGHAFQTDVLMPLWMEVNKDRKEPMPWLAALVCCAAFDLALHDAFGNLLGVPTYVTYNGELMGCDLSHYLDPAEGSSVSFAGVYPEHYLRRPAACSLRAWHLVGGQDALEPGDLRGDEPADGYPVVLRDWIRRDGLKCLKIKLRGNDVPWDDERLRHVGRIAIEEGVDWLSADFNCMVTDPSYVTDILDRLLVDHPRIHGMVLYVEQPFPYELEQHPIDVHSVSARKPLFMDESSHDWSLIRLGRSLGWTGVALKTCKTQTGALLSLCWARAHGMTLMVQDLTNSMLAQVSHCLLAAHAGTIMGVETNGVQFCPEASRPEAAIHPGLFERRKGGVTLESIGPTGFGYRIEAIGRALPDPAAEAGT